jgi:NAD(P)-dependent dehydrogenase (short-subunit alcohol dehydrogenase family)
VNTGLLVWPSSIESGGPSSGDKVRPFPVGQQGDKLFVYSPKESAVFEVDKVAGTTRKITTAKVEFQSKELPTAIDVVSDGLILSSEQNILKIDFSGNLKYSKYYPAPREPALLRALYAAQAVRAAYIGAAASAYSAEFAKAAEKTTDPSGKAVGKELSQGFADLSEAGFNCVYYSIKASLAALKKSKGYIITMASLAGTNFFATASAYNASKFGLVGFTQAVMLDLRNYGIKVTTIMPGSVATNFNNHTPSPGDAWKIQPEDLGQMVVDLLNMNPRTLPSKIEVRPSVTKSS